MITTWLLVAGRQEAVVYRVAGTRLQPQLEPLRRLALAPADSEDRPDNPTGLLARSMHGSFVDLNGPARESRRRLARLVVDDLRKSHLQGAFRQLYVAAPAAFVGSLRECYGGPLGAMVAGELVGDFLHESVKRLTARVAVALR